MTNPAAGNGAGSSTASSSSEDEDSLSLDVSELEKANAAGLCLCGREGAALSTELASASDDKLSASARFICREDMVRSSCSSVLPPCLGFEDTDKKPLPELLLKLLSGLLSGVVLGL